MEIRNKSLHDIINLKGIVEEILRDYELPEDKRLEAANRVHERYSNLVKEIFQRWYQKEQEKRSSLALPQKMFGGN